MEPRWSKNVCMGVLWSGCLLCVIFVTGPACAITIHADSEVIVQNGTTAVLRCIFDSSEVVTRVTSMMWSFQSNQPDSQYFSAPHVILYFTDGKAYPGQEEFKHRVQFVGDINKKDASIQLSPAEFSDNGTFFCDVKNPPDVSGTQGQTELRVIQEDWRPVQGESSLLPETFDGDRDQHAPLLTPLGTRVHLQRIRQAESLDRIKVILNDTNLTDINQLPET